MEVTGKNGMLTEIGQLMMTVWVHKALLYRPVFTIFYPPPVFAPGCEKYISLTPP